MLGLPSDVRACLFDLDGLLTQTAKVHAAAWKAMFDEYLRGRADERGVEFTEFDSHHDYDQFVDGKPRYEGVRSFLESRNIELPEGAPTDSPEAETIDGLGNRKNDLVQELIRRDGVQAYDGSVDYVKAARAAGLSRAVVSSSANAETSSPRPGFSTCSRRSSTAPWPSAVTLRASPRPTRFSPRLRRWGWRLARPRCSRTPLPASRPGAPVASESWSAWTESASGTRLQHTAPTSSSTTWQSC